MQNDNVKHLTISDKIYSFSGTHNGKWLAQSPNSVATDAKVFK